MAQADLDAITARFAAIPAKVKAAIQPAIDKGCDELVARMQYLAPDEDATGKLRNSIKKVPGPVPGVSATVVAGGAATTDAKGDDHALNQEYGTAKMHRHSFFWPSVDTLKTRVRRRVDRAIGQAVKAGWD